MFELAFCVRIPESVTIRIIILVGVLISMGAALPLVG